MSLQPYLTFASLAIHPPDDEKKIKSPRKYLQLHRHRSGTCSAIALVFLVWTSHTHTGSVLPESALTDHHSESYVSNSLRSPVFLVPFERFPYIYTIYIYAMECPPIASCSHLHLQRFCLLYQLDHSHTTSPSTSASVLILDLQFLRPASCLHHHRPSGFSPLRQTRRSLPLALSEPIRGSV